MTNPATQLLPLFRKYRSLFLPSLLFFCAFIVRSLNLSYPPSLMVDEVYYVPAANSLLNLSGDPNYVHPPLGKLLIASGIALFGYNSFGWRIAGVIAGSVIVLSTYFLGRRAFGESVAVISSALLIIDPLQNAMSRIAMLDIFLALFVALAFLFACYDRFALAGVFLGLATGVKLSGAFAAVGVVGYILCSGKAAKTARVIPMAMSGFLLSLLPIIGSGEGSFTGTFWFITNWHLTLEASHPSASSPIGWLFDIVPFPIYAEAGHHISASANPFIYPIALPVAIFLIYQALKNRSCSLKILPVFWFVTVYGLFFALPRKTQFIFYLTPAVPAILLLVSYGIVAVLCYVSK